MHKIFVTPYFKRLYKKKDRTIQERTKTKIKILAENCFDPRLKTHKIYSRENVWSFRITDNIRILFIFDENNSITLIDIGTHNHVYRKRR